MKPPAVEQELEDYVHQVLGLDGADITTLGAGSYSSAYRVERGTIKLALLLRRTNKSFANISAERQLLAQLNQRPSQVSYPNPLLVQDVERRVNGRLVSVYRWIDHQPFDGSSASRVSAFKAFTDTQRELQSIDNPTEFPALALVRHPQIIESVDFRSFCHLLPDNEEWSQLYKARIEELAQAVTLVSNQVKKFQSEISYCRRQIIHYDPNPANFGFKEDGQVTVMFDFDQCKFGIVEYDIPWLVWSFAAHETDLLDQTRSPALLSRLTSYLDQLEIAAGLSREFVWTLLLFRFCLTLHGRLLDTYRRGFPNLSFMKEKVCATTILAKHFDNLKDQ